jgi:hypothetical protein
VAVTPGDGGGVAGSPDGAGPSDPTRTTVVLFLVDGLMYDALATAMASGGARNFKFLIDNGVRVEITHSTSPAAVIELPDGTQPWLRATSGNVAVHTGCHLFESRQMDDIFLAARAAGIKSVFAGGDDNYGVFTTADFHYGMRMEDAAVVQHGIDHLRNDHVRLLRLHLQRVRDFWTGPADKASADSAYVKHLLDVDVLLGNLIAALKDEGVWESAYIVLAADHGMGQSSDSAHVASTLSSWEPLMAFYGPDIKKGATIPYAELPDIAVTTARFLGLAPLKGHLDPAVNIPVKGATGTVLTNLFVGAPAALPHPRYVERCLALGTACTSTGDTFGEYRRTMLGLIK